METFRQMMQTYVKCFVESEQGQAVMKNSMATYMNNQCVDRLTALKEDTRNPLSFLFLPYKQVESLLEQCREISDLLEKPDGQIDYEIISQVIACIYECCNQISEYFSVVFDDETQSTKFVDAVILNNKLLLLKIKPRAPVMTREEFLALTDDGGWGGPWPERADESKLRKYGYNVAQNSTLSNKARQELLKRLIETKVVSKGYVERYLEYVIRINGKKSSNASALDKWESDLRFVQSL